MIGSYSLFIGQSLFLGKEIVSVHRPHISSALVDSAQFFKKYGRQNRWNMCNSSTCWFGIGIPSPPRCCHSITASIGNAFLFCILMHVVALKEGTSAWGHLVSQKWKWGKPLLRLLFDCLLGKLIVVIFFFFMSLW